MKLTRLTVVLSTLLLLLCPAAQARTVLGLAPQSIQLSLDAKAQENLRSTLAGQLDDQVSVRTFDSPELLKDWMVRFNEVDIALVSQGFYAGQPSGTFIRIDDIKRDQSAGGTLVLIARQGMSTAQLEQIKQAFGRLSNSTALRSSLGLTPPPRPTVQKVPVTVTAPPPVPQPTELIKPAPAAPSIPAAKIPAPAPAADITTGAPAESTTPPAPPEPAAAPVVKAPATPVAPPAPAPSQAQATTTEPAKRDRVRLYLFAALLLLVAITLKMVLMARRWQRKKKPLNAPLPAPSAEGFNKRNSPQSPNVPFFWDTDAASAPPEKPEPAPEPPAKPRPTEKPIVTAVPVSAVEPKVSPAAAVVLPPLDIPPLDIPAATSAGKPQSAPPKSDDWEHADETLIVESGRLTGGKVPALLKRCADLPEPVILEVKKGLYQKRVYFAAGQIAHASPWCNPVCSINQQWDKLGCLLVRDGLVSESALAEAMEQIERQPGQHLGQVLIKLGALDLGGLRQALNRQTRLKVFALILYPEGQYRVLTDDGSLSAEESSPLK